MNHLIPATATRTAGTCWIAMSESDEAGTTIFGVYLDEQQALAAAALIYPRGATR